MHTAHRVLPVLLLLCAAGCKNAAPPPRPAAVTKAPVSPIPVPPAPTCDVPAPGPASGPRGTVIALYHTANVVGEVEPCG
jgi:hypothetical protein